MTIPIRAVIYYLIIGLFCAACIGSVVGTYYVIEEPLSTSLYLVNIPFYFAILFYVLIQPLNTLWDDYQFVKEKSSVDPSELLSSCYMFRLFYSICERAFYAATIPITIYLLQGYDQSNDSANTKIAHYLEALGIYVLIMFARDMIGAIVEVLYFKGSMHCGRNIDADKEKDQIKLEKLFRIYLFERSDNGISFNKVNYSMLLNPIFISLGICLLKLSSAFLNQDALDLMNQMDENVKIMQIAILIHFIINTILMIIMMCMFKEMMPFSFMFYVYILIIGADTVVLFSTYFYEGLFQYLYNLSILAPYDASFVFYVIGDMGWYIFAVTMTFIVTKVMAAKITGQSCFC